MKRLYVALLIAGLCFPVFGAKAWWQSIQQVGVGGAASYQGPGDIVSGAKAFYSCARAYNAAAALAGVKACNICNVSDVVCADVTVGSNGFVTIPLIGGSDCSVVTCTIKFYYDQSGALNCAGFACDASQGTIANRAVLVINALGGRNCGLFNGGASSVYVNPSNAFTAVSQSFSGSGVAQRASGANDIFFGSNGNVGFGVLSSDFAEYASSNLLGGAADTSFHSFQDTANGASSRVVVDSTTTAGNAGTATFNGNQLRIGGDAFGNNWNGTICEAGIWPGFSTANDTAMAANQHGATNGYGF